MGAKPRWQITIVSKDEVKLGALLRTLLETSLDVGVADWEHIAALQVTIEIGRPIAEFYRVLNSLPLEKETLSRVERDNLSYRLIRIW